MAFKRYREDEADLRVTPVPKGGPQAWGADCPNCPLYGRKPVFGDGLVGAKLAIIGEAPGGQETDRGKPFIGRSGELLELVLAKTGTHRTHVWIDNAIACMPPDGDMKAFLRQAKKELGDRFRQPVDCCRPRLFHALGVPRCAGCHKYVEGPEDFRCSCEHPLPTPQKDRSPIPVVGYVGNFALESLHGYQGISAKRGYVDWAGRPTERPIPGQGHNGDRLDVKSWLTEFVDKAKKDTWTTTKPDDAPAPSSGKPATSRKRKGNPSPSASASGAKPSAPRRASSSSPPQPRGKKR